MAPYPIIVSLDTLIAGFVIFSKRHALSRAVVVNNNMSRGKYLALAREGHGSRLALSRTVIVNSNRSRGKYLAREGPGSRLVIVLRKILIAILSVSQRNCAPAAKLGLRDWKGFRSSSGCWSPAHPKDEPPLGGGGVRGHAPPGNFEN